jgi:tight adherence protein B
LKLARLVALVLTLAATLASTAAGAEIPLELAEAAGARFPDRQYVLSLPEQMNLSAGRVRVTENGKPVTGLQVIPAGKASKGAFGVVLAIDASNSMKGAAIERAIGAARQFLIFRRPNTSVAVVTFNHSNRVLRPFTTKSADLSSTLAAIPPLAEGTHIYDAVETSVELIGRAKITAGSIVVLSDGADTGSSAKLGEVATAARRAHIRLFTVGLRSPAFSPDPLRELATTTGGTYAVADSASELAAVYRGLGAQLSREYLLRYRSLAGPGVHISVAATVDGVTGSATSTYTTPLLAVKPVAPYHESLLDRALQSLWLAVLVSLLCAALVAFGVAALVRAPDKGVRGRIGEFVSIASAARRERTGGLPDRVLISAERSFERTPWWNRFKDQVELADIHMPPVQIVLWTVVGAFAVGYFFSGIAGSALMLVFGLIVPVIVYELIDRRVARKRRLFADQLPENLQVLASALRAGHSLVAAMAVVVDDAAEPTRSELRRVVADERLGVPLEDALQVVVHRMQSRELAQVSLVAALQRQTGGNAAEVLDRVIEVIRERAELRRLVRTLTAQGRLSRWILTGLPIGLMLLIAVVNPSYLDPLLHTSGGRIALVIAAGMVVAGSLAIQKLIEVKV